MVVTYKPDFHTMQYDGNYEKRISSLLETWYEGSEPAWFGRTLKLELEFLEDARNQEQKNDLVDNCVDRRTE